MALLVFIGFLATRLIGLARPQDEISDEFLYSRSAADYLNGKEPAEWTHPPLTKEFMAASMRWITPVHVGSAPLHEDIGPIGALQRNRLAWASGSTPATGHLQYAVLSAACSLRPISNGVPLGIRPSSLAISSSSIVVGGEGSTSPALVGVKDQSIIWRSSAPELPIRVADLTGTVFWIGPAGTLWRYLPGGTHIRIAEGAFDAVAVPRDRGVWVSFPRGNRVVLFDNEGRQQRVLTISGHPGRIAVPVNFEQGRVHTLAVVALDRDNPKIWSIDPSKLIYIVPSLVSDVNREASDIVPSRGGYVWTAQGRQIAVAEGLGLSIVHRIQIDADVRTLLSDGQARGIVALTRRDAKCLSWTPTFGLRLPSALAGAVAAAFVLLIAMRLSGSVPGAAFAAAFFTLDGFSFTLTRLAAPDYGVVAFVLAAWFCLLSALYQAGSGPTQRNKTRPWLGLAGAMTGFAAASKWNGAWALGGILLVVAWDVRARGREGIAGAFPRSRVASLAPVFVIGACAGLAYLAAWAPHVLIIGASPGDFVRAHIRMFNYHAHEARGFVSDQSPWYLWPLGAKPMLLHTEIYPTSRAELWILANPVVAYAGAAALIALLWRAIRQKSMTLLVLSVGAAFEYLPWIYVARIPFLYQYALVTPFLAISIGWLAVIDQGRRRLALVTTVLVAAILAFFALLPAMDAWRMMPSYFMTMRHWLPWMFNPPRLPLVG